MKVLDAIKKLNGLKNEDDELLIETIDLKELKGAKEKDLAEAFMTAIESLSEEDSDKYIPEELAALYNKLAGTEEEAPDPVTKKEPKEVAKKEDKKASAKETKKEVAKKASAKETKKEDKKAPAKEDKKEDKKAPAKGEGVIASILSIIKEFQPITKENIIKKLVKQFPDRDEVGMAKTVQVQIGGKGETRMEKEKGIKLKKSANGEISLGRK